MNHIPGLFRPDLTFDVLPVHTPSRDAAFGEALLAMTTFARHDPDMTSDDRPDDLLERAWQVLVARNCSFSAEDFALYFLSRLLERLDGDNRMALRMGAGRYLLEKKSRLSRDIAALAEEASGFLEAGSIGNAQAGLAKTPAPVRRQAVACAGGDNHADEFVFVSGLSRPAEFGVLVLT